MSFIPITRSIGAVTAPGQFNNPNPGYDGVEMAAIEAISASNRFLGLFASNFYDNVPDPLDVTRVLASASYVSFTERTVRRRGAPPVALDRTVRAPARRRRAAPAYGSLSERDVELCCWTVISSRILRNYARSSFDPCRTDP